MKKLVAAVLSAAVLSGCAVGPNYQAPVVPTPDQYREVQGPPQPAASLADQPWWDVFGDPVLHGLIDEALTGNYDVRIAAWRVDEFRARAGIARSEFFPSINYGAESARGRNSIYTPPYSPATGNSNQVNVNFGWELDVWGRIRRLNESAKAQYLSSEDARRGVLLSLVSEVSQTYFTLRELDAELEITKKTVASFQETYDLFKRKLDEGAASALETSYAEAALGQVSSQVPEIERRIEATENQLNFLLARNPAPIPRGDSIEKQPVPPKVPAGLPSELLQRRPDIRQAEQQLIAANAQVGVATANFFPRISLTGFFGAVGPELDNFFYPAGKTWSIAAGLLGPLFQGGRLRSEYDATFAQWEQTKAVYEQTVTGAFAETTSVLYARAKLEASVAELDADGRRLPRDGAPVPAPLQQRALELFRSAIRDAAALPCRDQPRPGAARPPERLRQHLQGARRRLERPAGGAQSHLALAGRRGGRGTAGRAARSVTGKKQTIAAGTTRSRAPSRRALRAAALALSAAIFTGPAAAFDSKGHVVIEALAYRTLIEGHDGQGAAARRPARPLQRRGPRAASLLRLGRPSPVVLRRRRDEEPARRLAQAPDRPARRGLPPAVQRRRAVLPLHGAAGGRRIAGHRREPRSLADSRPPRSSAAATCSTTSCARS